MDSPDLTSPFKFLDSYGESDRDIFFGREQETEALYEMVLSTRLVLVYGASGTGKTSLIRCGLANKFSRADWYAIYVRRQGNLVDTLQREINQRAITPLEPQMDLSQAVESLYYDYYVPIYLIFDQFEELFIMGSREEQEAFFTQIAELVRPQLFCKIIFSIREEYLAFLSDFERVLPSLYDHRLRVERMSRKNLLQVVHGTCGAFDIALDPPEETVEGILQNLRSRTGVDLTTLQVYLDRLYRRDHQRRGSADRPITFDVPLIAETGALKDVLAEFLDEQLLELDRQLPQPGMALDILFAMVTDNGTKRIVNRDQLIRQMKVEKGFSDVSVVQCLNKLKKARLLREWQETVENGKEEEKVTQLELAHDSLAGKIYDKVSVDEKTRRKIEQFVKERYAYYQKQGVLLTKKDIDYVNPYLDQLRLSDEEAAYFQKSKTAVRRRRQFIAGALTLFILIITGLGLKAWLESRKFQALYLNSLAKQVVDEDPTAALRITEAAMALRSNPVIRQDAYNLYSNEALYRILLKQTAPLKVLAVAPDGEALLTAALQDDSLRLWSLEGELLQTFTGGEQGHKHHIYAAAFSADGSTILSGSADRTLRLWNRADASVRQSFDEEHERPIEAVALSPDGTWALSGSSDETVRLWRVGEAGAVDTFYNYHPAANNLAFSPDGQRFALAHNDQVIGVYGISGDTIQYFAGHSDGISSLAFSPDGSRLLSGSADYTARLWQFGADSLINVFSGPTEPVQHVGFAPLNDLFQRPLLLIAAADGKIRIWEREGTSPIVELRGHEGDLSQAFFSPDGLSVFSAGQDSTVRSWSYPQRLPLRSFEWSRRIYRLRFNQDGTGVYSATRELEPVLWSFPDGAERLRFAGHEERVQALAVHDSDSLLISGARDGKIHLYGPDGQLVRDAIAAHADEITDLAVGPDFFISASADSTLRRFNLQGDSLGIYRGHQDEVTAVAIAGENHFFSGGADSTVYRRQIEGDSELLLSELPGEVSALALSPDGKFLAVGLSEGSLLIIDQNGQIISTLKPHGNAVTEIHFATDGTAFLTASKDNYVKLWTTEDRRLIQSFTNNDDTRINTAVFSPDQRYILGGSDYGQAYIWLRPPLLDAFLQSGKVQPLSDRQKERFELE